MSAFRSVFKLLTSVPMSSGRDSCWARGPALRAASLASTASSTTCSTSRLAGRTTAGSSGSEGCGSDLAPSALALSTMSDEPSSSSAHVSWSISVFDGYRCPITVSRCGREATSSRGVVEGVVVREAAIGADGPLFSGQLSESSVANPGTLEVIESCTVLAI